MPGTGEASVNAQGWVGERDTTDGAVHPFDVEQVVDDPGADPDEPCEL